MMTLSVRATRLANGIPKFLDHRGSKTLKPIDIKLDRKNYVGDPAPHANCGISSLTESCIQYAYNCYNFQAIYLNPPIVFFTFSCACTDRIV